jgi:FtsH-binding integral membrane protein
MTAVTPLTIRPFDDSTDSLLRFAMRLDATLSGLVGLFIALLADSLSALTGLSSVAEFSGGALLVLGGLAVYALAAAPDLRRVGVGLIVGNVVLTVAALVVVAAGVLPLTEAGVAATLATGGYFALMGYLQYLGVRRLPA